jgi:hypothetical protein
MLSLRAVSGPATRGSRSLCASSNRQKAHAYNSARKAYQLEVHELRKKFAKRVTRANALAEENEAKLRADVEQQVKQRLAIKRQIAEQRVAEMGDNAGSSAVEGKNRRDRHTATAKGKAHVAKKAETDEARAEDLIGKLRECSEEWVPVDKLSERLENELFGGALLRSVIENNE